MSPYFLSVSPAVTRLTVYRRLQLDVIMCNAEVLRSKMQAGRQARRHAGNHAGRNRPAGGSFLGAGSHCGRSRTTGMAGSSGPRRAMAGDGI